MSDKNWSVQKQDCENMGVDKEYDYFFGSTAVKAINLSSKPTPDTLRLFSILGGSAA